MSIKTATLSSSFLCNINTILLLCRHPLSTMFPLRHVLNLIILCLVSKSVFGYQIDQSCAKEGIEEIVKKALESAFEMAQAAHDRLTASPVAQSTWDLVGKILARPKDDPKLANTAKTVDTFALILQHYRREVQNSQFVDNNDVVSRNNERIGTQADQDHQKIFCNLDRFRPIGEKKKLWMDGSEYGPVTIGAGLTGQQRTM